MAPAGQRIVFIVLAMVAAYFAASYAAGTYEPVPASERPQPHSGGPFVGTINGFEFFNPATGPAPLPRGCTADNSRQATEDELAASALGFRVDSLPEGAQEVGYSGLVCGDAIVTVVRSYVLGTKAQLDIARIDGEKRIPAVIPKEGLLPVTINGRLGIANRSLPPVRHEELYLDDSPGYLYVSAINLSHDELVQIAGSIVNLD